MTTRARVLLTNDDGVDARGLRALHAALVDYGFDVLVVAPVQNQSGVSRSASYRRPVVIEPLNRPGVFACHGTPVDWLIDAAGIAIAQLAWSARERRREPA